MTRVKNQELSPQCHMYHDEKLQNDINKSRQMVGLSPLEMVERVCLNCSRKFKVLGKTTRLCYVCRDRD